ncbi:MAG: exodeoxyribonuclease VII large subunit [Oscillospiraceae bacterium]|nr:exodeoxyribonuclease VII large subunit [Oscillospiraceae bacterium]
MEISSGNNQAAERQNIFTVCELNEYIKNILENDRVLRDIYVKGEISNFTNHRTGHFYFTVKDDKSVLKAVMFGGSNKLKFMPENGMKVVIRGRISLFVRDGQYQIYCDDIEPDGVGSLYTAFEQLKAKLESEGLFDGKYKKPLPKIPLKIGVITSPTGAAIKDMINVITRRFPMAKIILFPALVQGQNAPAQLISGVKYINANNLADVIIIGRGGGSIEELWAFNDENLARSVFASKIPVISAVGHETDFTICDFAADLRAPTPSAAAELAVPDTFELKKQILNVGKKLELILNNKIKNYREKLKSCENANVLRNPANIIDDKKMSVLHMEKNLISSMQLILSGKKSEFIVNSSKLEALNPLAVLTRGYSVAYKNNAIVKKLSDVNKGEEISIKLSDGFIDAEIKNKRKDKTDK